LKTAQVDFQELERLLSEIRDGTTSVAEGLARVGAMPLPAVVDLGHTRVDTQRAARCGHPEVIFGEGKTAAELVEIARVLVGLHGRLIATRVSGEGAQALRAQRRHRRPAGRRRSRRDRCASPATASSSSRDVGVAGLHRLLAASTRSAAPTSWSPSPAWKARCLPCSPAWSIATGDRGADQRRLRRVVRRPRGAARMLNSCAAGVGVVNIDNGFGAGYLASQINLRTPTPQDPTN
jgi:NCAIR mutase (PurE)-related protein